MQVTKFNLVTYLQIMLSNATHSNFHFECNTERGSIDQLYIELGSKQITNDYFNTQNCTHYSCTDFIFTKSSKFKLDIWFKSVRKIMCTLCQWGANHVHYFCSLSNQWEFFSSFLSRLSQISKSLWSTDVDDSARPSLWWIQCTKLVFLLF